MARRTILLAGLLLLGATATAQAQGGSCELLPGAREASRLAMGDGRQMVFISGPAEFVCPGGTEVKADSAVGVLGNDEFEFIGHVFYADTLKTLTSDWARYVRPEGRLFARGAVVLTDRDCGSVVRGEELEYLREIPGRPEATATVRGRPHATLYDCPDPSAEPADRTSDPLEVDADRMEIRGEQVFLARGDVELTRGETRGFGREAEFDQIAETMLLVGDARVEGEEFSLAADRIDAALVEGELRTVLAKRDAILLGDELRVDAPDLRVSFVDGEVDRMIAVRGEPGDSAPPQPQAIARDFRLIADSLDALAPGQRIERIVAVGSAYGERTVDSLDIGLPDVISHDWLRGDTITGYFRSEPVPAEKAAEAGVDAGSEVRAAAEAASAGADSVEMRSVLERLVAVGPEGRARSLYRVRGEGDDPARPGVNYLVANRIVLVMRDGEVEDVEADGPIQGMHLQAPRERTPPPDGGGVAPPDPQPKP